MTVKYRPQSANLVCFWRHGPSREVLGGCTPGLISERPVKAVAYYVISMYLSGNTTFGSIILDVGAVMLVLHKEVRWQLK